jgi:hypothetical protein
MSGSATVLSNYFYPTPVSWEYPHLEVFVPSVNKKEAIYWKYRGLNSSCTTWNPTDGSLASIGGVLAEFDPSVAALTRSVGNVDVFHVGSTGDDTYHLYHWGNPTWHPVWWETLGEPTDAFSTAIAPVSWNVDQIDLFALGGDSSLCQQT